MKLKIQTKQGKSNHFIESIKSFNGVKCISTNQHNIFIVEFERDIRDVISLSTIDKWWDLNPPVTMKIKNLCDIVNSDQDFKNNETIYLVDNKGNKSLAVPLVDKENMNVTLIPTESMYFTLADFFSVTADIDTSFEIIDNEKRAVISIYRHQDTYIFKSI